MHTAILIDERRKLERHRCDLRVSCTPCASGSQMNWPGRVLDLSQTGIRLLVGRRFEAGTLLRFLLRNTVGEPLTALLGRVIHVSPRDQGTWLVGCSIAPQLTDEGLKLLLNA